MQEKQDRTNTTLASCPLCQNTILRPLYELKNTPVFQNKVYQTADAATRALTGNLCLVLCEACDFVYNAAFDSNLVSYDGCYENEQACSSVFQDHLASVIALLKKKSLFDEQMVEIGCGKGYFLEKLLQLGCKITGFDPAYAGDHPHIVKAYFNQETAKQNAKVILLRHVLEHVSSPFDFLHHIAESVDYQGTIYIEVPALEWIIHHAAYWDIFYEHCNYFTKETLSQCFTQSETGFLFDGQYLYLIAHLKHLKKRYDFSRLKNHFVHPLEKFKSQMTIFRSKLSHYSNRLIVWGAGAKGVTFTYLMDPKAEWISTLVDINPKKHFHYIAQSAHSIIPPDGLDDSMGKTIFVMNPLYYQEIKKMLPPKKFTLISSDRLRDTT